MLKRNLIAIAIIVMGLGITGAFGQDREAGSGLATGIKKPTTTVKKPKQVQPGQNSGGTITNQRTSRTRTTPTGITFSKIEYVRKPKSVKGQTEYVDNDEYRTKNPRNQKIRKPSGKNLGDTGTHEVGHKQRRSTQKRQHKP